MGFTIDMVSGEILDETLPQNSEILISDNSPGDVPDYAYTEQLESILVPVSETQVEMRMPESVSQMNIDLFIDQFS